MIYTVHNTGEWIRSNDWTSSTRTEGSVVEFTCLEEAHPFDREQFDFMLKHGFPTLSSGNTIWTIRKD